MSITGFLKTLILLGALQGFIVSVLLWASGRRRPEGRQSRRLLAWLIFLMALACLSLYMQWQPWATTTMFGGFFFALVPMIIIMPVGPLIYFYTRSCMEPDFRMTKKYRPHFYSIVVDFFQHAAVLVFVILMLTRLVSPNRQFHFGVLIDYYDQYADIPRWISLTIYLAVSTRYLKKRVPGAAGWPGTLLKVFWAFDLLWLVFLIPYELPRISDRLIDWVDWYPLYIPLAVMIYWLGIKGYFIINRVTADAALEKNAGAVALERKAGAVALSISGEKVRQVVLALRKAMEEERLWLDPGLHLGKLAQHCGVAPKVLSAILNQHMDTTFNEFVNGYRVNAVMERLALPESRELTIAGVAYECGFNSLPTFQRAFKLVTGQTPKEYLTNCDQIRI